MCAAMYVHTHMCAMHASVHDCFQAHICCYVSRAKYTSGGAERVRVCASSNHFALTPILSYIPPPFF